MRKTFADQSRSAFRQIIAIIIAVSGLAFFLIFKVFEKAYLYAGVLIHKIITACDCAQMTQLFAMHPFVFGAIAALSVMFLFFIFFSIYKLTKLIIQTGRFSARYLACAKPKHSAKLRRIIADLRLDKDKIVEVKDTKPIVFCFGLWNTKICISSGLIKILNGGELRAVLLHEDAHLTAKEPLKLFVIKLFSNIFFFLPGIKTYVNKYVTFSELAADERATDNFTDKSKLARAIFKISQAEERRLLGSELALSFFTSTIAERVNKLTDNTYLPKFKIFDKQFLFGLCSIIFTILFAAVLLADSAEALAMHNSGDCAANHEQPSQASEPACVLNNYQPICEQNSDFHQTIQSCSMEL